MDVKSHALRCLEEDRIMAVLRQVPADRIVALADALIDGGVRSLEITMDYDRAPHDVEMLATRFGERASIGVGTTWTVAKAEAAAAAGATFCVIPGIDVATAERSAELGMLTVPGVQTPAEIQTAITAGADVLKLYPADPPGPGYLAALVPAYGQCPFMATGGVTLANMAAFLEAGAMAVGMGNTLFGDPADPDGAADRIAAAVSIAQAAPR